MVLFAASWCRDSRAGVPVFALLETEIGLEVRVFGGMEPVPRLPPEAEEWGVTAVPTIFVFTKSGPKRGQEIGKIIERPPWGMTMEEELLEIKKIRRLDNSLPFFYIVSSKSCAPSTMFFNTISAFSGEITLSPQSG